MSGKVRILYSSRYTLLIYIFRRNLESLWLEVPEGCTQWVKGLRGTQCVRPIPDQTAYSGKRKNWFLEHKNKKIQGDSDLLLGYRPKAIWLERVWRLESGLACLSLPRGERLLYSSSSLSFLPCLLSNLSTMINYEGCCSSDRQLSLTTVQSLRASALHPPPSRPFKLLNNAAHQLSQQNLLTYH